MGQLTSVLKISSPETMGYSLRLLPPFIIVTFILGYNDACHPVAIPIVAPAAGGLGAGFAGLGAGAGLAGLGAGAGLAGLGAGTLALQDALGGRQGLLGGGLSYGYGGGLGYREPEVYLPPPVRTYTKPPQVTQKPERPTPQPPRPNENKNDPKPEEDEGKVDPEKEPGKDKEKRKEPSLKPGVEIDVDIDVNKKTSTTTTTKPGCVLRINSHLDGKSALLLKPTGSLDGHRFFLPDIKSDTLLFESKESILLACPGNTNNIIINGLEKSYKQIMAQCDTGNKFKVDGVSMDFSKITCKHTPESSVIPSGKCYNNLYEKYNIGFQLMTTPGTGFNQPQSGFINLIDVCYDKNKHITFYTKFNIMKGVENRQKTVPRATYFNKFIADLSVAFDDIYRCSNGRYPTFENLLGSKDLSDRYIGCNNEGRMFLSKGHLAAYADFVYYSQQKATMYYINAVPQWQTFNVGNWKTLEDRIRKYAQVHNNDLTVYVGTQGILTLPDKNNTEREIYLGKDINNNQIVPVPQQLYRIVYDQSKSHGIVFIGINSVDRDVNASSHLVCQDVCQQTVSFFTGWNRMDVTKGFIYCCTLQDFLTSTGLASTFPGQNLPLLI